MNYLKQQNINLAIYKCKLDIQLCKKKFKKQPSQATLFLIIEKKRILQTLESMIRRNEN